MVLDTKFCSVVLLVSSVARITRPKSANQSQQEMSITTQVFCATEQPLSAPLLRILLIRAGIEKNPKPTWLCSVCISRWYLNILPWRSRGGKIAFVIHDAIHNRQTVSLINQLMNKHLEVRSAIIKSGATEITLLSISIPPSSICDLGYHTSLAQLLHTKLQIPN